MEEENKIETVNQENKSNVLETVTFIVAVVSAALNLFLNFITLCVGTNNTAAGLLAISIIEILVYGGAFVLYVITAIQNKKVKFDLTLVLLAIATVMLF